MTVRKWIWRKIKNIDFKKMNIIVDIISKNSGKSKLYIKLDIFINFLKRGIGYTDYFRGDYINLTKKEKDTFVTTKKFYKLIHYLNNEEYTILLKDKLLFNYFFKEYIKRDYISLKKSSLEEFELFLKKHDIVFAKALCGEGGHGITKVVSEEHKDKKTLYKTLIKNKQYLIEEGIMQSDELNKINPNVVNSFRIVTLYKDGKVFIINNALRINQDKSEIIGCTNDLYCSLNERGLIDSNVIDDYGKVYKEHPLTHRIFSEVKIPDVKKAFEMCKEAAYKIPEVRYIGWDVAFTNDGPIIVEGNEFPGYGLTQFYKLNNSKSGLLKELENVLKDEINNIK